MVTTNKDNEKDNILNFGISDILKSDEYFKYTAIIETSGEIDNLHDRLKFQHRILNTDKIQNRYIGQQKSLYRKKLYRMMVVCSVLVVLSLIILSLYQKVSFKIYQNSTDKEVSLYIDAKSNLYIDDGIAIPFISGKMISKGDLNKNYRIVPVTEYKWNNPVVIFAMTETLMALFLLGLFYFLFGGNSHIINVIRENEKIKKDQ